MRIKLKKIENKKGGDILGFAMILPALCIMIFAIIVIAQLCICRQSIEYSNYSGSRAAVICDTYADATVALDSVAKSTLQSSSFGVKSSDVTTSIKLVAGTSANPGDMNASENIRWEKGSMAQCIVTVNIKKIFAIGPDTMQSVMFVMVERPAVVY